MTQALIKKILQSFAAALFVSVVALPVTPAFGQDLTDLTTCIENPAACLDLNEADPVIAPVQETAEKTVNDTNQKVKETTEDPAGTITNDPTLGTVTGLLDDDDEKKKSPNKKKKATTRKTAADDGTVFTSKSYESEGYLTTQDKALKFLQEDRQKKGLRQAVAFDEGEPSFIEELTQALTNTLETFTFPMALIAIVAAFLSIQNRVDHKDPKLAMAPVSAEQDFLSFS